MRQLAIHEALLRCVEEIIGPDHLMLGSRFICKPPHSQLGVQWHRDGAYAGLDPPVQANVRFAMDDADLDNGCLMVLPKNVGGETQVRANAPVDRTESSHLDQQIILTDATRDALVAVPLAAGTITVSDGDLVPGSERN